LIYQFSQTKHSEVYFEAPTMTKQVNMHEAKSQLSKLGELVQSGERVVVAKTGKPYFDLVPHREAGVARKPGSLAGRIVIADDFNDAEDQTITDFETG
jgi:antitoxin (DNA-binding transcriptional repressor) of toxin-antitoxin stability system